MSYLRGDSPTRNFDKFQQQYNAEAQQHFNDDRKKKQLYYHIVQMEQANNAQRRKMERELRERQDQKMHEHWRVDRERYNEQVRRRKNQIDETRKINQNMSVEIMNTSKIKEDYIPHDNYNQIMQEQFYKQRRQQEQFIREADQYQQIKKGQEKYQKMLDMQVNQKKQLEQRELYNKRQADLKRIREKHQQDFTAYHHLDEHLKNREREQKILQKFIVDKGAEDQQAKLLEMRMEYDARERHKRQNFLKDLKGQLNNNQFTRVMDRKNQVQNDRVMIDQRNRYYSQIDRMNRLRKSHDNQQMLDILKGQVKPRRLLPEPDTPQKISNGSPVNIGKVMGDDRKRQLDWIEKSLLRQIHY